MRSTTALRAAILCLLAMAWVGVGSAEASVLVQWNTFGNAGTETTEPSVFTDASLTGPINLTLGAGVNAAANGNRFGGNAWFDAGDASPPTLANSIAGNDFIQFIISPNAGFTVTPTSLVFTWDRSGTGPDSVTLRSSADSFAADLGSVLNMGALSANTLNISGLTNVSVATTFRLYAYDVATGGAAGSAGTAGFDTSTNVVNVELNGDIVRIPDDGAVPEATSLLSFGGLLGSFVALKLGRRKAKANPAA